MNSTPQHSPSGSPFTGCHLHATTPAAGCPNCAQHEHAHEHAQPSLTDVLREITELGASAITELLEATDKAGELEALLAETQNGAEVSGFCHSHTFGPTEPCAECLAVARTVQL